MTGLPTIDGRNPGNAVPVQGPRPRAAKENKVKLLSQELSRERIREIERQRAMARVRAMRRARREAQTRAARVRRVLIG